MIPGTSFWIWDKYYRETLTGNAIGLTTRVKIDFTFAESVGMEFALFGILNKYKPFAGIEGHLLFGKVR